MTRAIGSLALFAGLFAVTAAADDETAAPVKAVSDAEFVTQAASGGMFEVKSSEVAEQKGTTDAVKAFAKQMIADHTQANKELQALASKKGWQVPAEMSAKHAEQLAKLGETRGPAFDAAYGRAQADAHQEAVALFRAAAQGAQDADLKAWAGKTLPTLEKHLEHARGLVGDRAPQPGAAPGVTDPAPKR